MDCRSVLESMSGGTPPTRVFCSGHSLGAGLVSAMRLPAWLQHSADTECKLLPDLNMPGALSCWQQSRH